MTVLYTIYRALVKDPQYGAFALRVTYLIDPKGTLRYFWPKVSPARHADQVLAVLDTLQQQKPSSGKR
jgi:peroxiredoxin